MTHIWNTNEVTPEDARDDDYTPSELDPVSRVWWHYEHADAYCECSICTWGPDEYIRNFLPGEY